MRRGGGWVLEIEWLDPSALLVNTGVFSGSTASGPLDRVSLNYEAPKICHSTGERSSNETIHKISQNSCWLVASWKETLKTQCAGLVPLPTHPNLPRILPLQKAFIQSSSVKVLYKVGGVGGK